MLDLPRASFIRWNPMPPFQDHSCLLEVHFRFHGTQFRGRPARQLFCVFSKEIPVGTPYISFRMSARGTGLWGNFVWLTRGFHVFACCTGAFAMDCFLRIYKRSSHAGLLLPESVELSTVILVRRDRIPVRGQEGQVRKMPGSNRPRVDHERWSLPTPPPPRSCCSRYERQRHHPNLL